MNVPPQKLFGWFRRLRLWATSDWQLHHDNAPAHASHLMQFFCEMSNHTGDSDYLQPRFGTLWLWFFPKFKSPSQGDFREISDHWWDSWKYDGAADGDWENCVKAQGAYFERDWGVIVLCTMFLVHFMFFSKCLYFSYYMAGYLLDRPPGTEELW